MAITAEAVSLNLPVLNSSGAICKCRKEQALFSRLLAKRAVTSG